MTSPGPLYRNVYLGRCVKWADVERFAPIMLGPLLSMTLYSKDICLGGLRRTLMDSKKKIVSEARKHSEGYATWVVVT
jgi:hypothetical protein